MTNVRNKTKTYTMTDILLTEIMSANEVDWQRRRNAVSVAMSTERARV